MIIDLSDKEKWLPFHDQRGAHLSDDQKHSGKLPPPFCFFKS